MVKEEVPPYAGRRLIKPGSLRFGRFPPVYGGNAKKTSQCRLASRVPPAYAGTMCFDAPTSPRKGSAPVYAGTELLFLVADRGAAGRVSGGVPVISLVRFLL